MKKNALRKDFFVEIRKSLGRFLSIFLIVALGVSILVGIRAAQPDMLMSGDNYADKSNLMDVKVVSTLGLTEDDVKALSDLTSVKDVEATYSTDVLCDVGDNMRVLHVMAQTERMNLITVTEGRLPEARNECLVDQDFLKSSGYKIGDVIQFKSGTEDKLSDTLKKSKYTIVGAGNSALYFSFERGSSQIGNGTVDGFAIVTPQTFNLDVYTEIYVSVAGAYEETAFTEEYKALIDNAIDEIEAIQDVRCQARHDELVAEIQEEIDDARDELNEERADAETEIRDAEEEILENEEKLIDSENELLDAEETVYETEAELNDAEEELAEKEAELLESEETVLETEAELIDAEEELAEKEAELLENEKTVLEGEEELLANEKTVLESEAELLANEKTVLASEAELLANEETVLASEAELLEQEALLEAQKDILGEELYAAYKQEIDAGKAEINASKELIATSKLEINAAKELIDSSKQEINAAKAQIETSREEINTAKAQIESGKEEINSAKEEIESGKEEVNSAKEEIASGKVEIEDAKQEIADGKLELEDAKQEIEDGKQEIEDGKQEIADAKIEVADAWKELEEEVADAEEEIADAEEEIADLELPEWYISDRDSLPEYEGYGDNANRVASLAVVFPSLFFFVAALISLTTMTRMVEEQRVQIGTLKALGYSKFAIMKKYVYYALSATLGGSAVGVLVGEKLFPYVIITAYHMTVYRNITEVFLPYRWGLALVATVIAVLCTGIATISSCYKELMAQPAILMRPEAPKIGKKTVIEKIPFLWNHLNFSWKSSLRNLFRYKKRFFMTLFGIGGCMGLLMVGYGLRDSISSISQYQYGELQLYDTSIFVDEDMEEKERAEIEKYVEENEDIASSMNVIMESITTQNNDEEVDAYLTVIGDMERINEFFVFRDRKTKELYTLEDDGVIISEKTADMLGAEVGSEILLTEDGKNPKEVVIADICENYFGHYVYMTETLYERVYEKEAICNSILIKSVEGLPLEKLEKIGEHVLTYEEILSVQYTANISQTLDDMLVALDRVMIVLILVAGLLSFVVLYNLNNINITERRRELATLKVLGFFPMEVGMYVYRENILLTLLGVIVGCGMGRFLHLFTVKTVEVDAAMFGRTVFLDSYLICALFTILFSIIVNWIMYFKLKRINMVESLKSVE